MATTSQEAEKKTVNLGPATSNAPVKDEAKPADKANKENEKPSSAASKAQNVKRPNSKENAEQDARRKKFKDIQGFLKSQEIPTGENLWTHMQEIFNRVLEHYPDQALEKIEEVSYLIKNQKHLNFDEYLNSKVDKDYSKLTNDLREYHDLLRPYFKAPQPEEEDAEVPEVAPVGFVQDLMADSRIFAWAGVGFGEMETYRLQKSMKKLATDSGATNLRFFGKIRGTKQDYYVVEATLEGGDDDADDGDADNNNAEPKGTGVNKFTYFVSHSSLGEWQKLPDLSPDDLMSARKIKVLLSGDLERPIYSNPFFFGKEKHYLRAQIARILHSTQLLPKNTQRLVEDSEREIEENVNEETGEVPQPNANDMSNMENWVHALPNILKTCRTAHLEPEAPEDQPDDEEFDPEEAKKQIEAADPYDPRLKPIVADNQIQISRKVFNDPWVLRFMGDQHEYTDVQDPTKKKTNEGVIVVRSLVWPGSYNFFAGGKVLQVYLGNGHKFEQQSFFPISPPSVLEDPEEYENGPEPTPLEEPVADAEENKDGDDNDDDDQ